MKKTGKQDREVLSVKDKPESTQKKHVKKVLKGLEGARKEEEGDWHQIADFSGFGEIPSISKTVKGNERPKMRQLIDSYPILAFRTIEGGMYSGLSSPNRPWLRFGFLDDELHDYQPARMYLDQLTAIILRMFDASNFYQIARQTYRGMARFGPAAGIMTEHWKEIAPSMALPIGSFWLGMNDAFKVDHMARDCPMTVDQLVKGYVRKPNGDADWSKVSPRIKEFWDKGDYQNIVKCRQLIEPSAKGKFQSTIWDEQDDREDALLEASNYNEQPFWGPRWDVSGPSLYGRGLGHDCLADMRELHMQARSKRELTDHLRKPATYGPAQDVDMRPGSHTYIADMSSMTKIEAIYKPDPAAMLQVREDIADIKHTLDRLTYADLFMAITNMPGVQPRNIEEIIKRDEEKLTQIGPVVEMVNDDFLPIAVERMIGIARRGNLLPQAPEELQGRELKIEFVSVLAMAQKMLGLSSTERFVGFVGSLGSVFGEQVYDNVNPDKLVGDYADRVGVPAETVNNEQAVSEIRNKREQAAQMEQMATMAGPARDATQAAKNIADMSDDRIGL